MSSIRRSDHAPISQSRVLLVSALFGVIAAGTVLVIAVAEIAEGTQFRDLLFTLLVSSAAGIGVGSLAGVNYDEVQATRDALETEVRRTRRLNQRLSVVNRVLRHNVRNTLAVALGLIDDVIATVEEPAIVERLQDCREALERLHSNAENALHAERLWDRDHDDVRADLGPMLARARDHARERAPAATVEISMPSAVRVQAHPLLPVAIEEAVENAVEHNEQAALHVDISVTRDRDWVTITIADDGRGIPKPEVDSLEFDEETPLEHTSGVGLWLIKWVSESSGGAWEIGANERGGTTVRIEVPGA